MKSFALAAFLAAVAAVSAAPAPTDGYVGTIELPVAGQVFGVCDKVPFTITGLPTGAVNIGIGLDRDDTELNFIGVTPTQDNSYINPEGLAIPIATESPFAGNMTGVWNIDTFFPGFQGGQPISKGPSTQITLRDNRPCAGN